jgi:hypothetical protein
VEKPNFKGFMADSAQANWNAVCIVYGCGDLKFPMENRERTWITFLQCHIQKYIKPSKIGKEIFKPGMKYREGRKEAN